MTGLLYLVGGLATFNSIVIVAEKLTQNKTVTKGNAINYDQIGPKQRDLENLLSPCKATTRPLTPLSNLFLGDFHSRLEQKNNNWYLRNNSFLDWNDWARTNPQEARDICIEADYFFGNNNVLP